MASPWKFLARLISPVREQKSENGSTDEVTPDALTIAGPTETPAEESLNSAGQPAGEELPGHDQAASVSAEPVHSKEAENGGRDTIEREAPKVVGAADPALFGDPGIDVTAAYGATNIKRAVAVAPRKQRSRNKEAVAIENVSKVHHTADEMNLDEEIRVLRGQLARKLKLQNAQLRKMLMRFER